MAGKCKECVKNMNWRDTDDMQITEETISCEVDQCITEDRNMLCS